MGSLNTEAGMLAKADSVCSDKDRELAAPTELQLDASANAANDEVGIIAKMEGNQIERIELEIPSQPSTRQE